MHIPCSSLTLPHFHSFNILLFCGERVTLTHSQACYKTHLPLFSPYFGFVARVAVASDPVNWRKERKEKKQENNKSE